MQKKLLSISAKKHMVMKYLASHVKNEIDDSLSNEISRQYDTREDFPKNFP